MPILLAARGNALLTRTGPDNSHTESTHTAKQRRQSLPTHPFRKQAELPLNDPQQRQGSLEPRLAAARRAGLSSPLVRSSAPPTPGAERSEAPDLRALRSPA
jgi:hypothetical protein